MRDVYEVLREKELAVQRVDREIRVLRWAAALLAEDTDSAPATARASATADAYSVGAQRPSDAARPHGTVPSPGSRMEAMHQPKSGAAKRFSDRLKRLAKTPLLAANRAAS